MYGRKGSSPREGRGGRGSNDRKTTSRVGRGPGTNLKVASCMGANLRVFPSAEKDETLNFEHKTEGELMIKIAEFFLANGCTLFGGIVLLFLHDVPTNDIDVVASVEVFGPILAMLRHFFNVAVITKSTPDGYFSTLVTKIKIYSEKFCIGVDWVLNLDEMDQYSPATSLTIQGPDLKLGVIEGSYDVALVTAQRQAAARTINPFYRTIFTTLQLSKALNTLEKILLRYVHFKQFSIGSNNWPLFKYIYLHSDFSLYEVFGQYVFPVSESSLAKNLGRIILDYANDSFASSECEICQNNLFISSSTPCVFYLPLVRRPSVVTFLTGHSGFVCWLCTCLAANNSLNGRNNVDLKKWIEMMNHC